MQCDRIHLKLRIQSHCAIFFPDNEETALVIRLLCEINLFIQFHFEINLLTSFSPNTQSAIDKFLRKVAHIELESDSGRSPFCENVFSEVERVNLPI